MSTGKEEVMGHTWNELIQMQWDSYDTDIITTVPLNIMIWGDLLVVMVFTYL